MTLRRVSLAGLAAIATLTCLLTVGASPASAQQLPRVEDLIGAYVSDASESAYPSVAKAIEQWLKNRNLNAARGELQQAKLSSPKLPPAEIMLAQLLAMTNNGPAARAELELGVGKNPNDPEFYIIFGDIAFQERRFTDAQLLFEKAAKLVPEFSGNEKRKRNLTMRSFAGNAAVLEAREKWTEALEQLKAWIAVDDVNAPAHQRMGRCLFKLNKIKEAGEEFTKAANQDERMLLAEIMMARMYDEIDGKDDAKTQIKKALTMLNGMQRADDKTKYINNMLAVAQWAVSNGYLKKDAKGQEPSAQDAAERAYARDNTSLEAQIVSGIVARLTGDTSGAELYFDKANRQSPANFVATNNLALTLVESSDASKRDKALQLAAMNVNNAPRSAEAYATLGWIAYKTGRKKEAGEALNVAMSSGQLSADAGYYVAQILFDEKKFPEAKMVIDGILNGKNPFPMRTAAEKLQGQVESELKRSGSDSSKTDKK